MNLGHTEAGLLFRTQLTGALQGFSECGPQTSGIGDSGGEAGLLGFEEPTGNTDTHSVREPLV